MANTKQIRGKIKSVKNLQKIIRALEVVSTIKLQKLKDKTNRFKAFVLDFLNILQSLKDKVNLFDFDKTTRDPDGRRLIIVITSDKGLCGGINSKLLKHISGKYRDRREKTDIIAIGKKGLEYFIRCELRRHALSDRQRILAGVLTELSYGRGLPSMTVRVRYGWNPAPVSGAITSSDRRAPSTCTTT